jgi:putative peptidoglycan lipid II flippase
VASYGTARGLLLTGSGVAIAIALGRLSGLAREVVLAREAGGATAAADVSIVVLGFPDFLVSLIISGALTAVLVPEFQRAGAQRAAALFVQSSIVVGGAMSAFALVGALVAPWLIRLLAPGFEPAIVGQAVAPFRWMLWAVPFAGLSCVTTAWLNASDRFFIAAAGTLVANIAIIYCLTRAVNADSVPMAVAAGIVVGSALRWGSQMVPSVRALSGGAMSSGWLVDSAMTMRYLHALGATSLLLFMPVLGRAFASLVNPGAVALYNYATKLVELPLGVAITVIATVLFPRFSRLFGDSATREDAVRLLVTGMQAMLLVSLAFMLPCVWFAREIAVVIFGAASMSQQDLMLLSSIAAIGFLSLVPQGIATLLIGALNADGDNRAVFRRVGLVVGAFALAGLLLVHEGGLAFLMSALVGTYALLIVMLVRRIASRLGTPILRRALTWPVLRAVLAALICGALVAWAGASLTTNPLFRVIAAAASGGVMLAVGFGSLPQFRNVIGGALR